MVQGVERFFKSAIVDKNSSISSAAIVSSYHLYPVARDVIRRWANEAQEAVNAKSTGGFGSASYGAGSYLTGFSQSSPGSAAAGGGYQAVQSNSFITQYHALGLLYVIRQQDRMAVSKLVQQLSGSKGVTTSSTLRNPLAICMLIRYAAKVMDEDPKCVGRLLLVLCSSAHTRTVCTSRCSSCSKRICGTRATWSITRPLERSARCETSRRTSCIDR